jgi:hypothetical protein
MAAAGNLASIFGAIVFAHVRGSFNANNPRGFMSVREGLALPCRRAGEKARTEHWQSAGQPWRDGVSTLISFCHLYAAHPADPSGPQRRIP